MAVVSSWFGLEVAGVLTGAFSTLTISSEVAPVEEGGELNGRRIRPTVTLGRRLDDDRRLFEWHETVVHGGIAAARRTCTVVVFDESGKTVARYQLEEAWPSKVVIAPLQVGPEEMLGESATFVCDDVRRVGV